MVRAARDLRETAERLAGAGYPEAAAVLFGLADAFLDKRPDLVRHELRRAAYLAGFRVWGVL